MEITLFYQKERKEFGRPVNAFAPSEVTVLEERAIVSVICNIDRSNEVMALAFKVVEKLG
jgi:hypothetical protein